MNATANLEDLARSVIRRQSWAAFLLFLAFWLGTATGLFIAFFESDSWQQSLLAWAGQNGYAAVIPYVLEGSCAGLTWQEWAAIGVGATALLLAISVLLRRNSAGKMNRVPGLRAAVRAERQRQRGQGLAIIGIVLVGVLLLPLLIAFGMWAHDHHWDDDWDD